VVILEILVIPCFCKKTKFNENNPFCPLVFQIFLVLNCLPVQEESTGGHQSRLRAGLSWDSGVGGLSATSQIATQLEGEELSDISPHFILKRIAEIMTLVPFARYS